MQENIAVIILLAIAVFAFFMSARSFREKGFLLNNAYIYATRQEREKMNKKPYYRQSAIVFLMLGLIFSLNALAVKLEANWMILLLGAAVLMTIIYATVSSIAIAKNKKKE